MQSTIPGHTHGSPQVFHPQFTVPLSGQPATAQTPAPIVGMPGGQGPVPVMVAPRPSGQTQAQGGTPNTGSSSLAVPGTVVFHDDAGQDVNVLYNALREEMWKTSIAPELRLAALMNFRAFAQHTINNAITLLRFDIAMDLMGRAPNDHDAVARALRPLVNSEIPSFYDGFLPFGVTVANANLANVDFGANALQAEMVFLPAQGPLQQLSPSSQRIPPAVPLPHMPPPFPAQQVTSPPSPSPVPPSRNIVPRHTVPQLVLLSPGQPQVGKQPAQSQ